MRQQTSVYNANTETMNKFLIKPGDLIPDTHLLFLPAPRDMFPRSLNTLFPKPFLLFYKTKLIIKSGLCPESTVYLVYCFLCK